MGTSCSRRRPPPQPPANDEQLQPDLTEDEDYGFEMVAAEVANPHPALDDIHEHPMVHNPNRERAIQAFRQQVLARRPSRLRRVFFRVLCLKRLRWLQSRVRSSLNTQKVKNSRYLNMKFGQLLSLLTREVSGTASWFSHLKRVDGVLYFVAHLSEKGNVTRETKALEKAYRRQELRLINYWAD